MNSYRRILATKPWSKFITDFKSRVTSDGGVIDGNVCNNQFLYVIKRFINKASLIITPAGYKSNKIFAVKPNDGNGDLIWTRASNAKRINADGYIEDACYNLLTYSEQLNNAIWTSFISGAGIAPVITENSAIAPNGSLTADKIELSIGVGGCNGR